MVLSMPFFVAQSNLESVITELKDKDIPTDVAAFFNKHYKPVPESKNAAATFKEAFKLYNSSDDSLHKKIVGAGYAENPCFDQKIDSQFLIETQKHVNNNIDYFNKLAQIKNYSSMRFEYKNDLIRTDDIRNDSLTELRCTIGNYEAKIEIEISRNDPERTKYYFQELCHLSNLISQDPTAIGQSVFIAGVGCEIRKLQRGINRLEFSSESLQEFADTLKKQENIIYQNWHLVLDCETANMIFFYKSISKFLKDDLSFEGSIFSDQTIQEITRFYVHYSGNTAYKAAEELKLLQMLRNIPVKNLKKINMTLEEIEKQSVSNSKHIYMSSASACINVLKKITEMVGWLRSAQTACMIERFRLKYGRLPDKLEQLVPEFLPEVPIDPIDGKKLRYYRGKFKVEYKIPKFPSDKEKNKKESMFGEDMFGPQITYTPQVIEKDGYYIYSIGKNLNDKITYPIKNNPYFKGNTIFTVVK
jgi:hypothetical protein